MLNLNLLVAEIIARKWIVVAAILVGGLVALMKQGWLGAWIARKLPPVALPYLAVVLGALGFSATEIVQGKPFGQAIVEGIASGMLAVFGHQTLIEGLRGGKELVPSRAPAVPPAPPPPAPVKEAA